MSLIYLSRLEDADCGGEGGEISAREDIVHKAGVEAAKLKSTCFFWSSHLKRQGKKKGLTGGS